MVSCTLEFMHHGSPQSVTSQNTTRHSTPNRPRLQKCHLTVIGEESQTPPHVQVYCCVAVAVSVWSGSGEQRGSSWDMPGRGWLSLADISNIQGSAAKAWMGPHGRKHCLGGNGGVSGG